MRSLWEPAAMSSRQCSVAGFASRGEADFANKQRHLDNLAAKDRSPPPTDPQHGYQASELVVQIRFEGQLATLCGHSARCMIRASCSRVTFQSGGICFAACARRYRGRCLWKSEACYD